MLALIIISAYLLIGLYFRPYSHSFTLIEGAVLHVLWLPAVILIYVVLRFGNRI